MLAAWPRASVRRTIGRQCPGCKWFRPDRPLHPVASGRWSAHGRGRSGARPPATTARRRVLPESAPPAANAGGESVPRPSCPYPPDATPGGACRSVLGGLLYGRHAAIPGGRGPRPSCNTFGDRHDATRATGNDDPWLGALRHRPEATELPYGTTETYRQILVVEGEAALPTVAPVHDGHAWGLSTRWDDSNPNALNIRRKMLDNGIRGSFYLNSATPEKQEGSLAAKLSDQGICSVGGHSVSHPKLPELPANDVLYQLLDNRIALECLADRPVNSLAFPYGQYQAKDRPEVLHAISEAFLRTGFHHCVYSGFVVRNKHLPAGVVTTGIQVVPGDRQVDRNQVLRPDGEDPRPAGRLPQDLRMHLPRSPSLAAGRGTGEARRRHGQAARLGRLLALHPDRMGRLREAAPRREGDGHRPRHLRAAPPRRLRPRQRHSPDARLRRHGRARGHGGRRALPGPPRGRQDLRQRAPLAPLRRAREDRPGQSRRRLRQVPRTPGHPRPRRGGEALLLPAKRLRPRRERGIVTIALPPSCDPGLLRDRRPELAPGETWTVAAPLRTVREGEYWTAAGRTAPPQVDFLRGGERGRLFATCLGPAAQN